MTQSVCHVHCIVVAACCLQNSETVRWEERKMSCRIIRRVLKNLIKPIFYGIPNINLAVLRLSTSA